MKTGIPKPSSYHEVKVGKTLYRVTSTYKGEIELGKALEDITVKKVLRSASPLLNAE
jgi:LysM repeat protein